MPRLNVSRKKMKQDLKQTRTFVEDWLGRGSAHSKITRNPNTYLDVIKKRSTMDETSTLKRLNRAHASTMAQAKSSIIFLKDQSTTTMAHEFAHSAINRLKRKYGVKDNVHAEETIAYSLMLDWAKKHEPEKFDQYRRSKWKFKIKSIFGPSHTQNHLVALLNALRLQERFSESERRVLIKELLTKQFQTPYEAEDWLREAIKAKKA